jgi:membrane protease YdiL (CAAX protease family)
LVLFGLAQLLIAVLLWAGGTTEPWRSAAAWWPLMATLANLAVVALLIAAFRAEGGRFWSLFHIERATWRRDVLVLFGMLLLAGPIVYLPNVWLATALFGGPLVALELMMQPLPLWGWLLSLVVFPLTIPLAELPLYFGYLMPRLQQQVGEWAGLLLPVAFLALQHATLPLIFDGRYLLWRALMYLPFALFTGLLLRWRPRLLPYFVVFHGVIDLAAVAMVPIA